LDSKTGVVQTGEVTRTQEDWKMC